MSSTLSMQARRLAKLLLPPIVLELVRLVADERRFGWQGIDYGDFLGRLPALNNGFVLSAGSAMGNFPTLAAKQRNLEGKILAYWFLNLGELKARDPFDLNEQKFDQSNFPETHASVECAASVLSPRQHE
jgi:hypothetical protein